MRCNRSFFTLLLVSLLAISSPAANTAAAAQDFDFFYFVLQWPGSYCGAWRRSCCYPTTGKPAADFGIHGLWPNYNDGSYPSNCDPDSNFDADKIKDLMRRLQADWPTLACPSSDGLHFWAHQWYKHGTCSESVLDQRQYFRTALDLKKRLNLLGILRDAGIKPDGRYYTVRRISRALRAATGHTVGIECIVDEYAGGSQLYQIYHCLDSSATHLIDCPRLPRNRCLSRWVEFPPF